VPTEDVTAFGRPNLEGSFERFKQRYFTIPVPSDLPPLLLKSDGVLYREAKAAIADAGPGCGARPLDMAFGAS